MEVDVAEVGAPEGKKVTRSLLRKAKQLLIHWFFIWLLCMCHHNTYDFSSCFFAKFKVMHFQNGDINLYTVVLLFFAFCQNFNKIMLSLELKPQINCQQLRKCYPEKCVFLRITLIRRNLAPQPDFGQFQPIIGQYIIFYIFLHLYYYYCYYSLVHLLNFRC